MRLMAVLCMLVMNFIPNAHAEVELKGKLVIEDSFECKTYTGQVINNSETPVTNVAVIVTVKDSDDNVIEVVTSYIEGYINPGDSYSNYLVDGNYWLDENFYSYLPAGAAAPFFIWGEVDFEDVASYSVEITYDNTSAVNEYQDDIILKGDINFVDIFSMYRVYGEIENRSGICVKNVEVKIIFEDKEGTILETEYTWILGRNYLKNDYVANDMIMSNTTVPLWTSIAEFDVSEIASYYAIINYEPASVSDYQNPEIDKIDCVGDITTSDLYGMTLLAGEILNDSQYDLHYVMINFIQRDSQGKIIDISSGYIESNILHPGEKAPFQVLSDAELSDIASYEYVINYEILETIGVEKNAPVVFGLKGNYPNPFNPVTTIEFSLPEPSSVRLVIFNASGQKIEELVNGRLDAGQHSVVWDASQNASGAYICRLMTDKGTETRKMLFLK